MIKLLIIGPGKHLPRPFKNRDNKIITDLSEDWHHRSAQSDKTVNHQA